MRDFYTLLADDNSAYSSRPEYFDLFKAHIIYNVILNDGITFSDNQVICSRNLRRLAAEDRTIIDLFEHGAFGLALREGTHDGQDLASIKVVHEAFVKNNKIRFAETDFSKSAELLFIEKHSRKKKWSYDKVSQNFTETCQSILFQQFRPLLSGSDFDFFSELIREAREKSPKNELGRQFLQIELPETMKKFGLMTSHETATLLQHCTDAPYLSNLPKTIDLDPIYAEEHKPSFELVRGYRYRLEDIEAPKEQVSKLDFAHYVAGLNRLTCDDVLELQNTPAKRAYVALLESTEVNRSRLVEMDETFSELNIAIEARIFSRFDDIARSSPTDTKKLIRKQRAMVVGRAMEFAVGCLDVTCTSIGWPNVFGGVTNRLIDHVKEKIEGPERPHAAAAQHRARMNELSEYLRGTGEHRLIRFEDDVITTDSFERETIIS